jgi:adenosine deaminase
MSVSQVELHCHSEGAATPAFVRTCAARNGVSLPANMFTADGAYACEDFLHFLSVYEIACTAICTPRDYADLVCEYFTKAAQNGLIYGEMFISSDHPADVGIHYGDFLDAIADGYERAHEKTGITARFILTCVRQFGVERAKVTARLAHDHPHPLVTGFGMGGDENWGQASDFTRAYDIARDAGLGLTVHAGEVCGAGSVNDCLDALKPSRIGHGVRAIEDKNVVARLADEGVTLEICPGSNIALGVYDGYAHCPIMRLRDAGVKVTIGSDDPPYFHTDIANEYAQVQRAFALADDEMRAISETGLEAAFCDEATRAELLGKILASG